MQTQDPRPNWLFIDMNSFFASAEQHDRPELRGHPVGIVPVQSPGAALIAASADAKALGLRTGTRAREAEQRCPGIRLVTARPHFYADLHAELADCIDAILPIERAYSIDEWAVRLLGSERDPARAIAFSRRIKHAMRERFSPALTCSIGIAPTRLLAKIACELRKPDGLSHIGPGDMPACLEHLKPRDLCGIAAGIEARLHAAGITTIPALWRLTRNEAVRVWGSVEGARWWAGFHGIDEPERPTRRRTMGHANVLEPRLRTPEGAYQMLVRLTHRLGIRLRTDDLIAEQIRIAVRGQTTIPTNKQRHDASFEACSPILDTQNTPTLTRSVRELYWSTHAPIPIPTHVDITVFGVKPRSSATGRLFHQAEHVARETRLSEAMDEINRRWGLNSAYLGAMHGCAHPMDQKIAFGRVPSAMLRQMERQPDHPHGRHSQPA